MAEEKINVLGGKGMLGWDVCRLLGQEKIDFECLDLPEFDITNYQQLKNVIQQASVVLNCAAYTNVDGAESQPEEAFRVNAEAVGNLGRLARENGTYVLHISTDFVFDGRNSEPYKEIDPPSPVNTYGKSKFEGEKKLAQSGCRHSIMRTEWTYGVNGQNFVTKLLQKAKENSELPVVEDQTGAPTATEQAARAVLKLLEIKPKGIYHFANSGYASRYIVAKFIVERLNMAVKVVPCKTEDFPTPAKRPLNSRFDCTKIRDLLGEPIENWQRPLVRFLEQVIKRGLM